MEREGEREERTTITVSRSIKDRFLEFVGAPKRYDNADEALTTLLDNFESKDKRGKLQEETVDGVHAN
jgi:hypothetical protein